MALQYIILVQGVEFRCKFEIQLQNTDKKYKHTSSKKAGQINTIPEVRKVRESVGNGSLKQILREVKVNEVTAQRNGVGKRRVNGIVSKGKYRKRRKAAADGSRKRPR